MPPKHLLLIPNIANSSLLIFLNPDPQSPLFSLNPKGLEPVHFPLRTLIDIDSVRCLGGKAGRIKEDWDLERQSAPLSTEDRGEHPERGPELLRQNEDGEVLERKRKPCSLSFGTGSRVLICRGSFLSCEAPPLL